MAEPALRCAAHPEVATNLRCGKCGKPICPRCMVQTPVGARCRECAQLRPIPAYQVSWAHYVRATGAGLGAAIACGLLWSLIRVILPLGYLSILLGLGAGWAIAEVVSLAVNRKRGPGLAAIGAGSVVAAYLVSLCLWSWGIHYIFSLWGILALILGVAVAVSRLR
ncbi:MAG TPA: hypothetical protein G4O03_04925 [Dehalococcoidia bacterium]|nr:hypothetical protein [Dehalococcoidia bacterium]